MRIECFENFTGYKPSVCLSVWIDAMSYLKMLGLDKKAPIDTDDWQVIQRTDIYEMGHDPEEGIKYIIENPTKEKLTSLFSEIASIIRKNKLNLGTENSPIFTIDLWNFSDDVKKQRTEEEIENNGKVKVAPYKHGDYMLVENVNNENMNVTTIDMHEKAQYHVDEAVDALNRASAELYEIKKMADELKMDYPTMSASLYKIVEPLMEEIESIPDRAKKVLTAIEKNN